MYRIVSLSGGIGSYITLKRVISFYPNDDIVPVFCDTLYEDGDLYRFLNDIENKFNIHIVRLCSGKTPLQLQIESKFIFNSRVALCSLKLKSLIFKEWLLSNYNVDNCVIYLGFDWSEHHRCSAIIKNYFPFKVDFPLCNELKFKQEYFDELENDSILLPRLYRIGLTHNNCGGRCVKAGIGHWLKLLDNDRNRFLEAENDEKFLQSLIGKDYTHLKRNGKPYSLFDLRNDVENRITLFNYDECNDFGACSCFSDFMDVISNDKIEK